MTFILTLSFILSIIALAGMVALLLDSKDVYKKLGIIEKNIVSLDRFTDVRFSRVRDSLNSKSKQKTTERFFYFYMITNLLNISGIDFLTLLDYQENKIEYDIELDGKKIPLSQEGVEQIIKTYGSKNLEKTK